MKPKQLKVGKAYMVEPTAQLAPGVASLNMPTASDGAIEKFMENIKKSNVADTDTIAATPATDGRLYSLPKDGEDATTTTTSTSTTGSADSAVATPYTNTGNTDNTDTGNTSTDTDEAGQTAAQKALKWAKANKLYIALAAAVIIYIMYKRNQ